MEVLPLLAGGHPSLKIRFKEALSRHPEMEALQTIIISFNFHTFINVKSKLQLRLAALAPILLSTVEAHNGVSWLPFKGFALKNSSEPLSCRFSFLDLRFPFDRWKNGAMESMVTYPAPGS